MMTDDISEYPEGQDRDDPNRESYEFVFHAPSGRFVHLPTLKVWPASGVDAHCGSVRISARSRYCKASWWIKRYRVITTGTIKKGEYVQ